MQRGLVTAVALASAGLACTRAPEPVPATGLDAVRQMVALPEEKIDLARAKLMIDQIIDPTIDVRETMAQLDSMARSVASRLQVGATSREKVEALRVQIYEPGPWNGNQPFRYDLEGDPFGKTIRNKLLATYLATKKGNCVSMPMLLIVVGQKLGIDLTASTAPDHVFVKYRDEAGATFNLEATSGAGFTSDKWMRSQNPMTDEALANGIYLQRLNKKETVIVMLGSVMEHYGRVGRHEERMELARWALEQYPKDVTAMLHVHAAHGGIIQRDYNSKYRKIKDIPPELRPRYIELNREGMLWRSKAEALGWREPDAASQDAYLKRVDAAKFGQ